MKDLVQFLKNNKIISLVFFPSLVFFIYQHLGGYSWDFSVYVMNAKFWLGSGHYFELARPPLTSFLLYVLDFTGGLVEYVFIVVAALLHLYSCMKFSEKFHIDKTLFYVFSMSIYVLIFGFMMGTELLSLALAQLFFAYLQQKRSGIFYALAVLARYNVALSGIFFLFQKNVKKIVLSIAVAVAVFSPWLLYNYLKTGNPLFSFLDSYALNFTSRAEIGLVSPFLLTDVLFAINFALPFLVLGLMSKRNKDYYLMLGVLIISLFSYASVPLKETRYLFSIVTPVAYFSAIAVMKLKQKDLILYTFIALTFGALILTPVSIRGEENPAFYESITSMKLNCSIQSNLWVPLAYYGLAAAPYPEKEQLNKSLADGYIVLLLKNTSYPSYARDESYLHSFPVIQENDYYITLGNLTACRPPETTELRFIDRKFEYYSLIGNNTTKCRIALPKYVCNILGKT